jgi:hypothetical protein
MRHRGSGVGSRGLGLLVAVAASLAAVDGGKFGAGLGAVAHAQLLEPPRARQGYYVAVGYHLALDKNWEDGESWGLWRGGDLTIRLGQLVTRHFGLGLQIHFGNTAGEGQKASIGGLGVEGQWELARNLALFGGAGLDVVSLSNANAPNPTTRGTVGSGYFLALGYDWFFTHRLTGGWAATPTVEARFVPGSTTSAFIGLIGVQLTYFAGLPRNQLDLPPGEAFKVE